MKSRFDQEVDAILEGWARAGFNALAALPFAATGILPANTALGSISNAYNAGKSDSTPTPTKAPSTTTPPPATSAQGPVPIKNISNFDTKLKNIIDTSNMQPADKTALRSALKGLQASATRQLTTQDVAAAVASLR